MKKITFLTFTIYILGLTLVNAEEGHSHELPEFLHFMEELIEEHSILRGATFGFIHTLIPLIGFYTGWSINRFLKILSNGLKGVSALNLILIGTLLNTSPTSHTCSTSNI